MDASAIFSAYALTAQALDHMRIESRTDSSMVLHIDCEDGTGTVRLYSLFPGMLLGFNDFAASSVLSHSGEIGDGLKLSYCVQGCCEVRMSGGLCLFLEPGNLSICAREPKDRFLFPGGRYQGVELFFHRAVLRETPPRLFQDMGIDMPAICERICPDHKGFIAKAHEKIKHVFMAMNNPPLECEVAYYRIKVIELLLLLNFMDFHIENERRFSVTTGQMEIAKQVKETIVEDLSRHYSIEKLAEGYGISPASLKKYFRIAYGQSISAYLREARMSAAATALKATRWTIADVAAAVGYENASKFTAAFKAAKGENPLEYRRKRRCGM